MLSGKLLKLKILHESHPTTWVLIHDQNMISTKIVIRNFCRKFGRSSVIFIGTIQLMKDV